MNNTIIYLTLSLSILINQGVYASMDETLGEFPEQELYLPDEPEYYEDEYYYEEEVNDQPEPVDVPVIIEVEDIDNNIANLPIISEPVVYPTTMIVANLSMVMQENNAEFLGYFFTLPYTLPADAKIVSAQMVFINSKGNQRITYPYRLYAEKSKNPIPLSLDNPISQRLENATTSFGIYDGNLQWAQGARWTINVTTPVQELAYKQVLGEQLVLIAENNSTLNQQLNYTFNEYVISLEIKIAGIHSLATPAKTTINMDESILAAINEIPSLQGMSFKYQADQLVAEKDKVKFVFSPQRIELTNKKLAEMYTDAKGQVIFTTKTGYMVITTPVLQNTSALETALRDFGLSQWQANQDGSVEVTVDAGKFVFRPAASSEPVTQLPRGIQMQGDTIKLVFTDEQGQLRQQLLYPTAVDTDNLLKIINQLPHTSQVKIDEMGYLSFDLADKTYRGLLSYQWDMPSVRTKDKAGLHALADDINQDGEIDYQIVYDNQKLQLLTSQRLTVN